MEIETPHVDFSAGRGLTLVRGYHDWIEEPTLAEEASLHHRFAVVQHTSRPERTDMVFDAPLFLEVSAAIATSIAHDSVQIEMEDGPSFRSFEGLRELYEGLPEMEREPPSSMQIALGDDLVCVEETEFWNRIGGPRPYHDSYTFSFYTCKDHSARFRSACEGVCRKLGGRVLEIVEGDSLRKPEVPWWQTTVQWIRKICTG